MDLSREQIRVLIYYEWIDVKDATEIHARITRRLGDNVVSKSTIEYWMREFRFGRQSLGDEPRSGRPPTSMTDENVKIVRDLIRTDPRTTYDQLEHQTKISRGSLHTILHQKLGVHKMVCRFIPHKLTDEQKKARVSICSENLKMWRNHGKSFINKIITGDETYVHYYDAPTRQESKIWVFEDEAPPPSG